MHPFLLTSQILRFVSTEPEAKNSPNGWNSTLEQFALWPTKVRTTEEYINHRNWRIVEDLFVDPDPKVWSFHLMNQLLQLLLLNQSKRILRHLSDHLDSEEKAKFVNLLKSSMYQLKTECKKESVPTTIP
jgi:hypothetical protein